MLVKVYFLNQYSCMLAIFDFKFLFKKNKKLKGMNGKYLQSLITIQFCSGNVLNSKNQNCPECTFTCFLRPLLSCLPHQDSSGVLPATDYAVPVQYGLLLLTENLEPSMCLQRHDVHLALPGWLPDLYRHWQGHGEAATWTSM